MTRFILGSMFYLLAAMSAFAGPGYYEIRVADCSPAAMQRAADELSAQNRAVISVVKCDAAIAPAAPVVTAPVYVAPEIEYIEYDDFDCDCDMDFSF